MTLQKKDKAVGKIDISIVVPLYNEEENVPLLMARVTEVLRPYAKESGQTWELIAVDDGSRDATAAELAKLVKGGKFPELKPVYFRRNYGQTAAMQAGFDHASGAVVVTMDGDLQNDPHDIPRLLAKMEETGADIVSGWRKKRIDHGGGTSNFMSRIANRLLPKITGVTLHDSGCSLKAYRAEVLEGLHIYGEMHRFIPAVAMLGGAHVEEVVVNHQARQFGKSKYGIDKSVRVLLDMLQLYFFRKFLHRPLHAFGYAGLCCIVPGLLAGFYLLVLKVFGEQIGGRPLLLLSMLLILIGVQLLGMGILAELLVRIYHEPGGRKQYRLRNSPRPVPGIVE